MVIVNARLHILVRCLASAGHCTRIDVLLCLRPLHDTTEYFLGVMENIAYSKLQARSVYFTYQTKILFGVEVTPYTTSTCTDFRCVPTEGVAITGVIECTTLCNHSVSRNQHTVCTTLCTYSEKRKKTSIYCQKYVIWNTILRVNLRSVVSLQTHCAYMASSMQYAYWSETGMIANLTLCAISIKFISLCESIHYSESLNRLIAQGTVVL